MAKPPLSMKPTGWFQVAWSDEIAVGDVHAMTYFGRRWWRGGRSPVRLTVMDAYCEHLGAHLGFGGHVVGEVIECAVPRLAVESRRPQRLHPLREPAESRRRMRTYPVAERNASIYIWHDVAGREPFFDAPDVSRASTTAAASPTTTRSNSLYEQGWNCIRSTCSKTASTSRISSSCTRRRSCRSSPDTTSMSQCPTSTSPSRSKVMKSVDR